MAVKKKKTSKKAKSSASKRSTKSSKSTASSKKVRIRTNTNVEKNSKHAYLMPNAKFSQSFMETAANLMDIYLHCWNPKVSKEIKQLKSDHYTVIGYNSKKKRVEKDCMIYGKDTQAKALVVENDYAIVVTFRGTLVKDTSGDKDWKSSFKNIMSDLNVPLIKGNKNVPMPGRVHQGFYKEYLSIHRRIRQVLKTTNYEEKPVIISGFSLGAAIASLCLWDIKKYLDITPYGYLFACPAAGDEKFADKVSKNIKHIYTFAHEKDPIGQMPQCLFKTYKPLGSKLFVFSGKAGSIKKTVEQIHHKDMDLNVKIKRLIVGTALTRLLGFRLRKRMLFILSILGKKVGSNLSKYHKGGLYHGAFQSFCKNFDSRRARGSSLAQASKKHYSLCQKYGLRGEVIVVDSKLKRKLLKSKK